MRPPPGRSAPAKALAAVTGLPGALAALATLGALAGALWWPLDLLSSFHPQYAVVLAAAATVHLAVRMRATAAWLAAGALLNAVLVAPHLVGAGLHPDAAGPRLTVMSFNVGVSNPMRQEMARFVAEEDPDLLFVLESSFEWEDALERWGPPMAAVAIVPQGRVAGITVTADPALGARSVPVPFAGPDQAAAVEVTLGGRSTVVLALHPPSPTTGARAGERDRILAAAGDWAAGLGTPVLVVGDLNATPWSHGYAALRFRGRLVDTSRSAGLQPTWPAGWGPLMIPIDHALHTGDLATVARETGPSLGSAHLPLLVTVAPAG